jgi:hypothetical protein
LHDDAYGDRVSFIQEATTTDVLDEATNNIYAFLKAIDGKDNPNQHRAGSRMPFAHWKSLPMETQTILDTIPDKDKATILGSEKGTSGSNSCGTRPTHAQFHNTSDAKHIAAYLHKLGIEEVPPEMPTDEVPVEDIPPNTDKHWFDEIQILKWHSLITLEVVWATKWWPHCVFAFILCHTHECDACLSVLWRM